MGLNLFNVNTVPCCIVEVELEEVWSWWDYSRHDLTIITDSSRTRVKGSSTETDEDPKVPGLFIPLSAVSFGQYTHDCFLTLLCYHQCVVDRNLERPFVSTHV